MTRRHGFTLIETMVAAGVSAVLMLSLGSTILIAVRAVPTGNEPLLINDAIERGLNQLRTDITEAIDVYADDEDLLIAVPDRNGNGIPELIAYSVNAGGMVTRSLNEGERHVLFGPVADLDIDLDTSNDVVLSMHATFEIPSARPSRRSITVRLLNTPEER